MLSVHTIVNIHPPGPVRRETPCLPTQQLSKDGCLRITRSDHEHAARDWLDQPRHEPNQEPRVEQLRIVDHLHDRVLVGREASNATSETPNIAERTSVLP